MSHARGAASASGVRAAQLRNDRAERAAQTRSLGVLEVAALAGVPVTRPLTIEQMRDKRLRARNTRKAKKVGRKAHYEYCHKANTDVSEWGAKLGKSHPITLYLKLGRFAQRILDNPVFTSYMLVCIITAGIVVGVQTYPAFESNSDLAAIDTLILVSFWTEVILKIIAEGIGPFWYFIGPAWGWNLFDLLIVIFSIPGMIPGDTGQTKLLRVIRLARLAKIFRKIEMMNMIISGLIKGLQSVVYILLLLLLICYLYACAGVVLFRDNASWPWHSIEISLITLLSIAVFDNWDEYFFTSYYGCDVYPSTVYTTNVTLRDPDNALGGVMWCQPSSARAQPVAATIFYLSFIAIISFTILSLFIANIAGAMIDSVNVMRAKMALRANELLKSSQALALDAFLSTDADHRTRKQARMQVLFSALFRGQDLTLAFPKVDTETRHWLSRYKVLAHHCNELSLHPAFQTVMTCVITLAGLSVGLSTDEKFMAVHGFEIAALDVFVLVTFCCEIVVQIVAEGLHPERYFHDQWNVFDFVIVALSLGLEGQDNANFVTMIRLLRLLRVLKLLRAVRELQVIVSALFSGMHSVVYIVIFMAVFYYFFAAIATTFFGENDPFHFATLHMSMLALFDLTTMDGWYSTWSTSAYGCLRQPGNYPDLCSDENNNAQFVLASIFFPFMVIFGGLVLNSLFVGVVLTSVDEAQERERKDQEIMRRAKLIADKEKLSPKALLLYRECFDLLDLMNTARLAEDEVKFGLRVAGFNDEGGLHEVWTKIDRDHNGALDFSEFLETMLDLKSSRGAVETVAHKAPVVQEAVVMDPLDQLVELPAREKETKQRARRSFLPAFGGSKVSNSYRINAYDVAVDDTDSTFLANISEEQFHFEMLLPMLLEPPKLLVLSPKSKPGTPVKLPPLLGQSPSPQTSVKE